MKYYYTHNCGHLIIIDSEEYSDFFSEPDKKNGITFINSL